MNVSSLRYFLQSYTKVSLLSVFGAKFLASVFFFASCRLVSRRQVGKVVNLRVLFSLFPLSLIFLLFVEEVNFFSERGESVFLFPYYILNKV